MKSRILICLLSLVMLAGLFLLSACGGDPTTATTTTSSSPAVTTSATTTATTAATPTATSTTPAEEELPAEVEFAGRMAGMFTDMLFVDTYYADGIGAMSGSNVIASRFSFAVRTAMTGNLANVPPEFMEPLPPGGSIPAPPGACPGGAKPTAAFKTGAGTTLTPEYLDEKNIRTLPTELVLAGQNDPNGLMALISSLVPMGDRQLADPAYWNTVLWDQLAARMQPAESLMDYLVWNDAAQLEQMVITQFRQQLAASGVPAMVLNAFDASNTSGWYTSTFPQPGDELAMMDIQAEMTGSVNGTVHEWREFSIPGLGQEPVWGVQYGDGTVHFDLPEVGTVYSNVDINLDQFDEKGRAIGGWVRGTAVDYEGIEVLFTYKPDGSKDGQVFMDGELIGELTMTVDHEKFENYVDVKKGTRFQFPEYSTQGEKPQFTQFQ